MTHEQQYRKPPHTHRCFQVRCRRRRKIVVEIQRRWVVSSLTNYTNLYCCTRLEALA